MYIIWLALFVVLLFIEISTFNLTTIWFAFGALAAFIFSLFDIHPVIQFTVFVIVSLVLLLFTKPLAEKYLKSKRSRTNCDMLIGAVGKVVTRIDNNAPSGAVYVDGKEWTARMAEDSETAEVDENVTIIAISGVKLIVEKSDQIV